MMDLQFVLKPIVATILPFNLSSFFEIFRVRQQFLSKLANQMISVLWLGRQNWKRPGKSGSLHRVVTDVVNT